MRQTLSARILLIDIETAPGLGWAWSKFDTNIIEFEREWFILSVAYKWLGDDTVVVKSLPDYPGYGTNMLDDKTLMQDVWSVLDEADIVVAHNGASFDVKKLYTRLLVHDLKPPSPFKTYDTLKEFRKIFGFTSNRLNDLCKILGIGGKIPHVGFALWKGCMSGDMSAWETMVEYNAQDVVLLEKIYLRLLPWGNHPDVNLYGDDGGKSEVGPCPNCSSNRIQRRGVSVSRTRKYQRLNCQGCGKWFQGPLVKDVKVKET